MQKLDNEIVSALFSVFVQYFKANFELFASIHV